MAIKHHSAVVPEMQEKKIKGFMPPWRNSVNKYKLELDSELDSRQKVH